MSHAHKKRIKNCKKCEFWYSLDTPKSPLQSFVTRQKYFVLLLKGITPYIYINTYALKIYVLDYVSYTSKVCIILIREIPCSFHGCINWLFIHSVYYSKLCKRLFKSSLTSFVNIYNISLKNRSVVWKYFSRNIILGKTIVFCSRTMLK